MMTTTNFIFTCGGRTIPSGGGSSANGSGGTWSRSRSIRSSPSPSPWHLEQEQEHLVLVQELQGAVVQCWEMSGGQLFWIFFYSSSPWRDCHGLGCGCHRSIPGYQKDLSWCFFFYQRSPPKFYLSPMTIFMITCGKQSDQAVFSLRFHTCETFSANHDHT